MEQKVIDIFKYFTWYNMLSTSRSNNESLANENRVADKGFIYEWITLALMIVLTVITLYRVPSWENAFTDPCHLASILCAATVGVMFVTRLLGKKALAFEPIIMMAFLASMPLVYIASYLVIDGNLGNMWLWIEILGFPLYLLFAILGLKYSPWFLVIGIALHGFAWDIWHYSNSTYIPNWYAIGCLLADIGISLYVAARIKAWRSLEQSDNR